MRLRRVLTKSGAQVEVKAKDHWIPLSNLDAIAKIDLKYGAKGRLSKSVLSVLELGEQGWNDIYEELFTSSTQLRRAAQEDDRKVITPYSPRSFRDFMLFEEHLIDSTRGYVKRFMPAAYRVSKVVEAITRKPFKRFYPHPLWYRQPIYYFGNHMNFISEGDSIVWPSHTQALDYELELGAILNKPINNASPEQAFEAIGGYVVLNDVSARDVQKEEMESGFGPQRAKHFINAISSEVITADEAKPALDNLKGSVMINGKKVSGCDGRKAHYSISEAISFVSKNEQLHSGELFGSGTLPGGSGLETGNWVSAGDSLTLELEGIGSLTNFIKPAER